MQQIQVWPFGTSWNYCFLNISIHVWLKPLMRNLRMQGWGRRCHLYGKPGDFSIHQTKSTTAGTEHNKTSRPGVLQRHTPTVKNRGIQRCTRRPARTRCSLCRCCAVLLAVPLGGYEWPHFTDEEAEACKAHLLPSKPQSRTPLIRTSHLTWGLLGCQALFFMGSV